MVNDTQSDSRAGREVAIIEHAITGTLLRLHNEAYASGTEREAFDRAPIWMQRQANHLTVAVVTALDADQT